MAMAVAASAKCGKRPAASTSTSARSHTPSSQSRRLRNASTGSPAEVAPSAPNTTSTRATSRKRFWRASRSPAAAPSARLAIGARGLLLRQGASSLYIGETRELTLAICRNPERPSAVADPSMERGLPSSPSFSFFSTLLLYSSSLLLSLLILYPSSLFFFPHGHRLLLPQLQAPFALLVLRCLQPSPISARLERFGPCFLLARHVLDGISRLHRSQGTLELDASRGPF